MKLKRISAVFFVLAATVILVAGSYALSPPASQAKRHEPPAGPSPGGDLISFDAMYGVDGPFVGAGYPIRNVPGDELRGLSRSPSRAISGRTAGSESR